MGPNETTDDYEEADNVDNHHDKDRKVEEIKEFVTRHADETGFRANTGVEVWFRRKQLFQEKKKESKEDTTTPANKWIQHKAFWSSAGKRRFVVEGDAKVKTHYGHPGEHRNWGVISKIADNSAENVVVEFGIKHNEKETGEESDADRIIANNHPVDVLKIRDKPVDKEDDT